MNNIRQFETNFGSKDQLLTTDETAVYLGVGKESLNVWRATKRYNIPYIKVGKLVKYRKSDLDKWLKDRTCSCGSDNVQ